jgi:hypothetical protein
MLQKISSQNRLPHTVSVNLFILVFVLQLFISIKSLQVGDPYGAMLIFLFSVPAFMMVCGIFREEYDVKKRRSLIIAHIITVIMFTGVWALLIPGAGLFLLLSIRDTAGGYALLSTALSATAFFAANTIWQSRASVGVSPYVKLFKNVRSISGVVFLGVILVVGFVLIRKNIDENQYSPFPSSRF